jgi:hypothetical protein
MKFFTNTTLSLLSLCLMAACSGSGGSGSHSSSAPAGQEVAQNEATAPDGSNINGIYAAELWPVNYNLHFKTLGMAALKRDGDTFEAMVNMKYAPKGTVLKTAVYTARRCPTIKDDLNKDAYIDILEARLAIGKITIPFDSDLDSQMGGHNSYSASTIDGKFVYRQTASFSRMFADLQGADEDSSDQMVKIGQGEGMTLPGRIVLVQGLAETIDLPESVATTDGENSHATIPVACGVLWKVTEMPEELKQM